MTLHLQTAIHIAYQNKDITTEEWRFMKDYLEKLLLSSVKFSYMDNGYLQDNLEKYDAIKERCWKSAE